MARFSGGIAGLALCVAGAVKIWMHMQAAKTVVLPGCLGSEFIIFLDQPAGMQVHCWGCYAFGAGLLIVLGSRTWARPQHRLSPAPGPG